MGCIFEKTAYERNLTVGSPDVDRYDRLKLSSLLMFHQIIGELHLNEFGTTSNYMQNELGLAFVFTKIKVKIHRLPVLNEKVKLTTWCSELKGIRFYRNYRLETENGEFLTESKAEVICLDLKSRKPVRPNLITGFNDFLYNSELENSCEKPQKLSVPDGNCRFSERPVEKSDIDRNGHVNNTIYAEISVDCLNEKEQQLPLKSFEINFVNEVFLGEKINLKIFDEPNGKFILGEVSNNVSFTSEFIF